jgi:hypothetical protein
VYSALSQFCKSADQFPAIHHVHACEDPLLRAADAETVLRDLNAVWTSIADPGGELPLTHDSYLKWFHLYGGPLPYAHLDTVAPHVAARLKPEETKQLEEFLVDRKRIQANPTEQNILEALPGLLKEATEILGSGDSVNKTVYKQLSESVAAFSEALHKVKLVSRGRLTMLKSMRGSQAQKERLRDIKEDL